MIDLFPAPNERRNFVHKRIGNAVKGFVSSGFNPLGAVGGFIGRTSNGAVFQPPSRRVRSLPFVARSAATTIGVARRAVRAAGRAIQTQPITGFQIGGSGGCPGRLIRDPRTGGCISFTAAPSAVTAGPRAGPDRFMGGAVVMGQFGAGEEPLVQMIDKRICRPGMVLGRDLVCYNRSQLTNKERRWPRGRRPLLTGGDMRAISVAARAAGRLTRTTKRLQKIGLMKKATRPARKAIAPVSHHHD